MEKKKTEMKEKKIKEKKIRKVYFKELENFLKPKLSSRNLIKRINIWAIPLVRYSAPFLKQTWENSDKWNKEQENW